MAEGEHKRAPKEHGGVKREHKRALREQGGNRGEQRESTSTERALAGEQSGGTLISERSRVGLGSGMLYTSIDIYIYARIRRKNQKYVASFNF